MWISNSKPAVSPRLSTATVMNLKDGFNSTTTFKKLTSSYFHHASTIPRVHKTIGQSFDETVAKYPDHECYVFRSLQKRYTFQSFKEEVDCLAAALLDLGFEKNDRFGVWLPNTPESVAMSFATSKLGLIKVNINPANAERELEYCINKVGCKGLILAQSVKAIDTLSKLRNLVPELDEHTKSRELSCKILPTLKHVILTGRQTSLFGLHSYNDLLEYGAKLSHSRLYERQASIDPDAPAAIFFTSGTTGFPKAATLTNAGMLNLLLAQWEHFGLYFTRICVPSPIFHILGEMIGSLNVAVAKCKVVFPAILPDSLATMQAIQEEKCTAIIGAPVIYRDILTHPDRKKYDLRSLEVGELGASSMHYDFLRQIETDFPIKRVFQAYGLTENAALLTSGLWAGDGDPQHRLGSMGRCMQGIEIKVADQEGNAVPIGQQGEIWTRGYPIMVGYYNDPEKTREAKTSTGWFKTGDIATMDEDGYLYFVARQKEIIIRGGVNIYPIEVEKVIIEHPSVAEAQVFSIPDERYGEEICAWIKLKPHALQCQSEDIKTFLSDKLAFFKIPKHIRFVDKFIMTQTGKVQKFKLSESMVNELKASKSSSQ